MVLKLQLLMEVVVIILVIWELDIHLVISHSKVEMEQQVLLV